tara:strand:- start:513 stop:1523 length:1011 start_codon:yes stop_codon:yes gene_type:complete
MPYLGKLPTSGAFQKLDAISTVNDQAAYTMQIGGVNFSPESANNMLVTVNGILQSPTTNYTINGSTITFTSALVTGDVINSIIILGDVLNVGTPSDATVTNAKTNFVSTSSAAGLSIKGDGTTDGTVQLNCSQNSHGIKLASPAHSASQSYKLIFPAGNVTAGKFLKVDSVSGSGTTGIGTMTFGDGGKLLQNFATQISKTTGTTGIPDDNTTPTTSEGTQIYSQAITPSSSSNKILMFYALQTGINVGSGVVISAFRGSTCIGVSMMTTPPGSNDGFISTAVTIDSPSTTSETTYTLRIGQLTSGYTWNVGSRGTSDKYNGMLEKNTVILQEIGA